MHLVLQPNDHASVACNVMFALIQTRTQVNSPKPLPLDNFYFQAPVPPDLQIHSACWGGRGRKRKATEQPKYLGRCRVHRIK